MILDLSGQQLDTSTKAGQSMLAALKAMAGIHFELQRELKLEEIKQKREILS